MARLPLTWQDTQLAEGFYSSSISNLETGSVYTFLPTGYEPKYPYPLVVFFHDHGSCEKSTLKIAPRISRRNYICISLRGIAALGIQPDGRTGYTWSENTQSAEAVDCIDLIEQYMVRAVEQTRRTYHVHSERIYLAGIGRGADIAYRIGLNMPEKIAGIIALNGTIPPANGGPLFRLPDVRQLRILISHGSANRQVPLESAHRDFRLFYSAGVDVQFKSYPTNHRLHTDMFRDINRFIMSGIESEFGLEPSYASEE